MREKAVNCKDSISSIYRQCTNSLVTDYQSAARMLCYAFADSRLHRRRHRLTPSLPKSLQEIQIPDVYTRTKADESFLLHVSDNNDLIVFCSPSNLKLLCGAKVVSVDGTFDASPMLFRQLLTIHIFHNEKLLAMVYSVLYCTVLYCTVLYCTVLYCLMKCKSY